KAVRQLLQHWHKNGLSSRSMQQRLSSLRTFYRWLMREKQISANPIESISAPRKKKRLPDNLDVDQLNQLLDGDDDSDISRRDHAMMELFYSSGLRLAELVGLD